jgi:hypothetical protein
MHGTPAVAAFACILFAFFAYSESSHRSRYGTPAVMAACEYGTMTKWSAVLLGDFTTLTWRYKGLEVCYHDDMEYHHEVTLWSAIA